MQCPAAFLFPLLDARFSHLVACWKGVGSARLTGLLVCSGFDPTPRMSAGTVTAYVTRPREAKGFIFRPEPMLRCISRGAGQKTEGFIRHKGSLSYRHNEPMFLNLCRPGARVRQAMEPERDVWGKVLVNRVIAESARSHALRGNARPERSASRTLETFAARPSASDGTQSVQDVRSHAERGNEQILLPRGGLGSDWAKEKAWPRRGLRRSARICDFI